jgi:hypothetical protein
LAVTLLYTAVVLAVAANFAAMVFKIVSVLRESARAWAERRDESSPEIDGLSESAFRRAWFRAHGPMGAIHGYIGLGLAALVTAPALLILGGLWRLGWRLADYPPQFREGLLTWQFYLFFGMIAIWALIAGAVMHRYHKHRPRELRFELARERERTGASER